MKIGIAESVKAFYQRTIASFLIILENKLQGIIIVSLDADDVEQFSDRFGVNIGVNVIIVSLYRDDIE
ncbi:MAG: hypothetical protein IPO15_08395 [Anaerolineae bacterium]|uniref:hypothetical protein n=1 Tax=Candidatus Amarolinea dominans TaxID=3140696 RepID=UPI00313497C7|nr:hypothetical protein [Anaerolineae bacterium]